VVESGSDVNSIERMAKVVRDVRMNRIVRDIEYLMGIDTRNYDGEVVSAARFLESGNDLAREATVVDVTPIYNQWMARDEGLPLYDFKMAPPWMNALLVFTNSVGNIYVVHTVTIEVSTNEKLMLEVQWQPGDRDDLSGDADHEIVWDEVRWITSAVVFTGGYHSSGVPVPTVGPLLMWKIPVYGNGDMADIRWFQLNRSMDKEVFTNAQMTFLMAVDLCNCVNVVVATPERSYSRPVRRRLARTGVDFSEIHVRPVSKSYRGNGVPLSHGVPLSSVRGHKAEYGINGKGKLFGKYTGTFWIPQHARGSAEIGTIEQNYVTEAQ
jgi:hypothetical protein